MSETVFDCFINVYVPINVDEYKDSTPHKIHKFSLRKQRLHVF
jgi:hypothetical protein